MADITKPLTGPFISKVKLPGGSNAYLIKDAAVWEALIHMGVIETDSEGEPTVINLTAAEKLGDVTNISEQTINNITQVVQQVTDATHNASDISGATDASKGLADVYAIKMFVEDRVDDIEAAVADINSFEYEIWTGSTDSEGKPVADAEHPIKEHVIYLVNDGGDEEKGAYIEYLLVGSALEPIGTTRVNLQPIENRITQIENNITNIDQRVDNIESIIGGGSGQQIGEMAFADTASGDVTIPAHSATATYTPAGDVELSGLVASQEDITSTGNFTPAGTVSAPTVDLTKTSVNVVTAQGAFTAGSFTQGEDRFTANTPASLGAGFYTAGSAASASFTQGTDSFTKNVPTKLDTTKFSGGSKAADTFNFNANTPTTIDTTKFSGGTAASYTQGTDTFVAPTLTTENKTATIEGVTVEIGSSEDDAETLIFNTAATVTMKSAESFTAGSFTQGTDSFTANTPASLASGFYTEGTAATASFNEGAFTPASLGAGFYTEGTAADYAPGTDVFTFTANNPAVIDVTKFNGGTAASFTQGDDSFTAPSLGSATTESINNVTAATASAPTFTGTQGSVSVTGKEHVVDVTNATATFTGTQATITSTAAAETVNVTVLPD